MDYIKTQKNKILKSIIFLAVLTLAHLYLLRDGFWFYVDTAFWPKSSSEALVMFLQQLHSFTNLGYYLGYDQGLLSFSRVLPVGYISALYYIFGLDFSQVIFSLSGYVLTFISFYLFTTMFFKNAKVRFILSMIYTFSPLAVSQQTTVFYNAIIPLFLFSFYKFFYSTRNEKVIYLLVNIFSVYLWVSYIRFIQIGTILILPYMIYFILKNKVSIKKFVLYITLYVLLLLPNIYSFYSQIISGSGTAFNYANAFQDFVSKVQHYQIYNLLQSFNVLIYENVLFTVIGIFLFVFLLILIITFPKSKYSGLFFLNISLAVVGLTLYSLGNIFPADLYHELTKVFPFIVNGPFWALYIIYFPVIVLLGIVTEHRTKFLYIFAFISIILTLIPVLNFSSFDLRNYRLDDVPKPYREYFVKEYSGYPESTFYYPGSCWRAEYMDKENIPTLCINFGVQHYVSSLLYNPRLSTSEGFSIDKLIQDQVPVDNLRITHNLKNIFVANDVVRKKGYGLDIGDKEIDAVDELKSLLDQNPLLEKDLNHNFTHYYFTDKDKYDYYIYSPDQIYEGELSTFLTNTIGTKSAGVFSNHDLIDRDYQTVDVSYKQDIYNPTKYYIEVSDLTDQNPFLIQFNQSFSSFWDIKFISKDRYNSVKCIDNWQSFELTSNKRCQYRGNIFDIGDELFALKNTDKNDHLHGNLMNNLWVINPDQISNIAEDNTAYAIIYYKKQPWFIVAIIISIVTIIGVALTMLIQEFKKIVFHKDEKNKKNI